jgi:F0F1-type ATP synthase assembly protein I
MRQAFRDASHAALVRADALAEENERLRSDLATALATVAKRRDVSRRRSPHRAFVGAMLLSATLVAAMLLAAVELVSLR